MMKQRQCSVLTGNAEWCFQSAIELLAEFDSEQVVCLSDSKQAAFKTLTIKQAKTLIGQEYDAIVFDGLTQIEPDSFGLILGTIKAGGVLVLLLPEGVAISLWQQRFNGVLKQFIDSSDHFQAIEQGQTLPQAFAKPAEKQHSYQTDDQQLAIAGIIKVVQGHRRRPLVISADRGRGKSAALGIAAAQLLQQGKQTILITAPSLAVADIALRHAAGLLTDAEVKKGRVCWQGAEIQFIAPDKLIAEKPKADLVLVDEAAAIPVAMLTELILAYSRIVFATTLHGYEGTGRGFSIRFQTLLQQHCPGWRHIELQQAIRWRDDDELEAFGFKSLLLNAMPVVDEKLDGVLIEQCEFERLDRQKLLSDEQSLSELFGLMVLAHYRTRPADLKMMLDRDDVAVYVLRYQGHIVATAWLVVEGQIDDVLATAIFKGERRISGQLLPQSLLSHCGFTHAGALRYQRVMRIAVHPSVQRQGFGHLLLEQITQNIKGACDVLGASFAASAELMQFWTKAQFQPVRVGVQRDHVSDSHSVLILQGLSEQGEQLGDQGHARFQQQWPDLLSSQFKDLPADLVIALFQTMATDQLVLSELDWRDSNSFAYTFRTFESCQYALRHYVLACLPQARFMKLADKQQKLLVMALVQQFGWSELAKISALTGKTELVKELRLAVAALLELAIVHYIA